MDFNHVFTANNISRKIIIDYIRKINKKNFDAKIKS